MQLAGAGSLAGGAAPPSPALTAVSPELGGMVREWFAVHKVYLAFNAREIELDDARFDCAAANAESLAVSRHLCRLDQAQRARVAKIKALPAATLADLKLKAELARALYEFWDDLRCDDYPCGQAGRMVVEDVLAL